MNNEHDGMPGLAGIAAIMRWLEELIVILSAPLLMFGLVVTLVDLLTDGATTLTWPWLLFAWAISQALGIEANISGAAYKARVAWQSRAYFAVIGYTLLVLSLGMVAIIAGYTYAFHQSQGIPINETLRDLGIDAASWTLVRAILAVVLVVVSAFLRFTGKKPTQQDEAQKLRDEIELAPLRAQAKAAKVIGARTVVAAAIKGAPAPASQPMIAQGRTQENLADPYPPNETPWGPSPWGAPLTPPPGYVQASAASGIQASGPSLRLVQRADNEPKTRQGRTAANKRSSRKPRGANSWEAAARVAWQNGARSKRDLMRDVPGISEGSAQYWAGVFRGEERGAERARREA